MTKRYTTPELDDLFDRYRLAPDSTIFAPLADACRKAGFQGINYGAPPT